ncbi:spore coat protein [Ornithinibacillus sp. L9]|uniref:Spore coat protein n=1 Tax=Ornithinibacillus caprae TaxID=2678566 RepID=A0A6N8FD24_9BACI|nr:CotY/CotZ family spore coat protein [Ornithinibacillus caprae]MUK87460.1 spore coat protein [Ornithinibacillus caprae]
MAKCRNNGKLNNVKLNNAKESTIEDDCVCGVVRSIIEAQDAIMDDDCTTSCNTSIRQLLAQGSGNGPTNTTIPIVLYCEGTCKPFFGSGIFQGITGDGDNFFGCVQSPIFRAKNFVKDSKCCVKLELLLPVDEEGDIQVCDDHDVCSYFPSDCVITDFQATGICITVDLKHFMGVTCLDPVTPIPAHEALSPTGYR